MKHDTELNALGLRCPLPLLRTKELLRKMESGQILRVQADDPQAPRDIELYVTNSGHSLLGHAESADGTFFYIKKT